MAFTYAALIALYLLRLAGSYSPPTPPVLSPATSLPNKLYSWREAQQIRYQVTGPEEGEPVVLIHGLFVNSDHWRHTLKGLSDAGYRTYALDLWGCGYSSKPPSDSLEAQAVNGENRFSEENPLMHNVELGTASGEGKRVVDIELRHPTKSPYNFYTWSELLTDFCRDVVSREKVTLVCNSIGSISTLQAVTDTPDLYRGVFVVCPNFRELHSAEVPFPKVVMPIVKTIQRFLRDDGQPLFDKLAKPDIVKAILKEPYAVEDAVDDTLVKVLLDPLLTEGASDVVFDTLSYSGGPLPEQQLAMFPKDKPVWVCYGEADPWTPGARVRALQKYQAVEKVVGWDGIGHCPHDEAPELVNPLLLQFLDRVCNEECITSSAESSESVIS